MSGLPGFVGSPFHPLPWKSPPAWFGAGTKVQVWPLSPLFSRPRATLPPWLQAPHTRVALAGLTSTVMREGPRPVTEASRAAAKEVEAWRPSFTRAAAAGPVWRNLGPFHQTVLRIAPDNDGGRVTALAVHPTNPQILFVATQSGLFRCANADPAASGDWVWESLADALPSSSAAGNLSIGAIALNPADPDTIYAGMGDPFGPDSRGFYASHDGGATWSAGVLLGNATRTLDILALDADILLVGTNAGLWRSTNGGLTFSNLVLGGSQLGNAWSIRALSATDLVCTRGSQIFWSADRGATWTAAALALKSR